MCLHFKNEKIKAHKHHKHCSKSHSEVELNLEPNQCWDFKLQSSDASFTESLTVSFTPVSFSSLMKEENIF